jgi:hypothetical protein
MKEDTSVKYFDSTMPDAPVLTGTPGATIALLDACLVNGWGLKTLDSLVVAGNVATATISTGHAAQPRGVILIAGATPAALNGEWRVVNTTANTVTFTTAGIADQTATGAITLKIAPAGWAKLHSGTNLAVYQSTDPAGTQMCLRVDDTGTTTCRAVGYESMSSADVGLQPFPTAAQRAGGVWWQKSNTANTDPRAWSLAADGRLFYYGKAYSSNQGVQDIAVFGDIASVKSVDPYACVLFGMDTSSVGTPEAARQLCVMYTPSLSGLYAARSHSGIGGSAQCSRFFATIGTRANAQTFSGALSGPPYPNPADGGLYLSPLQMAEGLDLIQPNALRGAFPGYYCCPQQIPVGTLNTGDRVAAETALPGRTLVVVQSFYSTPPNNQTAFIDVTGPWR